MHAETTVDSRSALTATSQSSSAAAARGSIRDATHEPHLAPTGGSPDVTPGPSYRAGTEQVFPAHETLRTLMESVMAGLDAHGVTSLAPSQFLTQLRRCAPYMDDRAIAQVLHMYDRLVDAAMPLRGAAFVDALSSHEFKSTVAAFVDSMNDKPALTTLNRLWAGPRPVGDRAAGRHATGSMETILSSVETLFLNASTPAHTYVAGFIHRITRDFAEAEDLLMEVNNAPQLTVDHKAQLLRAADGCFLQTLAPLAPQARSTQARDRMLTLGPALDTVRSRLPLGERPTLMCLHYESRLDEGCLDIACRVGEVSTGARAATLLADLQAANLPAGLNNVLVLKFAEKILLLEPRNGLLAGFNALTNTCRHLAGHEPWRFEDGEPGPLPELKAVLAKVVEKTVRLDPRAARSRDGASAVADGGHPASPVSHAELLQMAVSLQQGDLGPEDGMRLLQFIADNGASNMPTALKVALSVTTATKVLSMEVSQRGEGMSRLKQTVRQLSSTLQEAKQLQAEVAAADLPREVKRILELEVAETLGQWQDAGGPSGPLR